MIQLIARVDGVFRTAPKPGSGKVPENVIQVCYEGDVAGQLKLEHADIKLPIEWGDLNAMIGKKFVIPVSIRGGDYGKIYISCIAKDRNQIALFNEKPLTKTG